ncbi:MAG: NAD(P)/FAD-dependent oxidoreductase [Acidimicrobiales bacterium]
MVIGAGPAGLTAARQLLAGTRRRGTEADLLIVEADDIVGGISRTVERDGWRFDIGGHRFFTKVPEVEAFWHEVLADGEFLRRPRMSRIFYGGKFYDYPLKAMNALRNLGFVESLRCVGSYAWARVRPPKDQSTFEGWVASRFGWRLYRIFFKTYTEKVWGVPANTIQADWAAQRIKNLSLGKAIVNALTPRRNQTDVTSLIEEFQYPRLGPGMMWEACRDQVVAGGARIVMETRVDRICHADGAAHTVWTVDAAGNRSAQPCDAVVSSMPLGELLEAMDPAPPVEVLRAAAGLRHRDFLTVALVVPEQHAFPDNWIYVHSPDVKLGRIQNFGSWSPEMVKPGQTCLGLEYFTNVGDEYWSMPDDQLIELAKRSWPRSVWCPRRPCPPPMWCACPPPTPSTTPSTRRTSPCCEWLEAHTANVWPVGRNGMHRYNNQDHSMLTAMLAAENILEGAGHDLWSVNVEEDYHEEVQATDRGDRTGAATGTGRAAPVTR